MQRRRLNHLKEDLQMAMLPCKRLFVATLVLLLFFSITARGKFFFLLTFHFYSVSFLKLKIGTNFIFRDVFSLLAARFLREVSDVAKKSNEASEVAKKSNGDKLVPNQDSELDGDELAAMDYSPAGKTPPIHN